MKLVSKGVYRLRKTWTGKCVLQERYNFPLFANGQVDSSIRVFEWHDVSWKNAPLLLFADAKTALKYLGDCDESD